MEKILCGTEGKLIFLTAGLWSPTIYFNSFLEKEFCCSLSFKGQLFTAP